MCESGALSIEPSTNNFVHYHIYVETISVSRNYVSDAMNTTVFVRFSDREKGHVLIFISSNRNGKFQELRMVFFVSWGLFGFIPTAHWVTINGGFSTPYFIESF